jgi:hypothetical protein
MRTGTKVIIVATILLGAVVAAASRKLYFIHDDDGDDLVWNSNEAYLFMGVARRGYRISYMEYPWATLKQLLYGVRLPDDQRSSVTVVHLTAYGVDRHVVEMLDEQPGNFPILYTPRHGYIYANCEGQLCKWTGNRFETATEEEQRRLDGTSQLDEQNMDKGWSRRGFGEASSDYQFAVDVGRTFKLEVTNKLLDRTWRGALSVDVVRPGQNAERIWYLDGRSRRVGRVEYEASFARH